METDADSLLGLSSDKYPAPYSASSSDDIPGLVLSFKMNCSTDHQLEEPCRDDASQEPTSPARPFSQCVADTSSSSDGEFSSGPVSSKNRCGTESHTASLDKPAEKFILASAYQIPCSVAPSPTSLEESIIAYFTSHNLETPGFSPSEPRHPPQILLSPNSERHAAELSFSAPEQRSSYILTPVPEKQDTAPTQSAPEISYPNPMDDTTRRAIQRRRFGPLWTLDNCALINLAMDVRNRMVTNHEDSLSCQVIRRLNGSFNVIYILQFNDGLKYVVRLPAMGWGNRWTPVAKKAFESQVLTMHLIRRMTDIPLPEIFAFDATQENALKAPYMVISFISGFTVDALWYDETNLTPVEERRSRILSTTAMAMAQLQHLKFDWIGSLQSNDEPDDMSLSIGPCYEWDLPSRHAELHGQDPGIRESGPFRTTMEYLTQLHDSQRRDSHLMAVGCRELLTRMIACLPLSVDETLDEGNDETFVLTAPDFDSQNFMIDEQGNLTGIIDWDHVHTMPRCLGYCRYPEWITRDCDPLRYEYPSSRKEDSPEQLRQYRQQYAKEMFRHLDGQGDARFAKKSHIFGSVWIAAARYDCQVSLMAKLLDRALARDQYLNKFALMDNIGEGDWVMSEAQVMDAFRALFEVKGIFTTDVANEGIK